MKLYDIIALGWFLILITPAVVLLTKLTQYLYITDFQEWWITMLWGLVLPATTLLVLYRRSTK